MAAAGSVEAPRLAPLGSDGVLTLRTSVHRAVGHTDTLFHQKCHLATTIESLWLPFSPSASRGHEAGCVSYANSYKALYGFHTGQ